MCLFGLGKRQEAAQLHCGDSGKRGKQGPAMLKPAVLHDRVRSRVPACLQDMPRPPRSKAACPGFLAAMPPAPSPDTQPSSMLNIDSEMEASTTWGEGKGAGEWVGWGGCIAAAGSCLPPFQQA